MREARAAVLLLAAVASLAFAQPDKVARIGFLHSQPLASIKGQTDALRAGLRELGYVEGKNLRIEYSFAEGNDRFPAAAAALVGARVDLIMASGTPASLAAAKATSTIPIVMIGPADPVRSGLVASLARPGGNATGVSNMSPDLMKKRLEMIAEAKPGIRRVAILLNASNPAQPLSFEAIQTVAPGLKVEALRFDVRNREEIGAALAAMGKKRVEAVIVGNDTMLLAQGQLIAQAALKHRMLSAGDRRFAAAGGLIGYGSSDDVWRHAANYVDKILKGAKPADLPIEQPKQVDLVLNMKTAKALGLALPQSFRLRVDKVIE